MNLRRLWLQTRELLKTIAIVSFLTFISALVAAVTAQYILPMMVAAVTSFVAFITPILKRWASSIIAAATALILGIWGIIGSIAYAFNLPFSAHYYATAASWGVGTAFILLPFIIGLVANLVGQEAPMTENMGEGFLGGAVLLVMAWLFAPDTVGSFIGTFGDTFMKAFGISFGALTSYIAPVFGIFMIFLLQGLMALLGAAVAEWMSPG